MNMHFCITDKNGTNCGHQHSRLEDAIDCAFNNYESTDDLSVTKYTENQAIELFMEHNELMRGDARIKYNLKKKFVKWCMKDDEDEADR